MPWWTGARRPAVPLFGCAASVAIIWLAASGNQRAAVWVFALASAVAALLLPSILRNVEQHDKPTRRRYAYPVLLSLVGVAGLLGVSLAQGV